MEAGKARKIRQIADHFVLAGGFSLFFGFIFRRQTHLSPFATAFIFSAIFGTLFSAIDYFGLGKWRHRSFFVTSLVRTLTYGITLTVGFYLAMAAIVFVRYRLPFFGAELWGTAWRAVGGGYTFISLSISMFLVFVVSAILAISRKLGPGVMLRWLTGRYHTPRAEEKVFMFLDIRDSTTLAETLGDLRFSALVRDFMSDLTNPVLQTRAEVSHYIGDEAVLVWRPDRAFQNDACVRLFILMRERIATRTPHYLTNYGIVPGFKAGIHLGTAIVTEVGEVKSEIVYHGDALNTTARIQGLCNELGYDLLVGKSAADRLVEQGVPLGSHSLKGKAEPVDLYGFFPASVPNEASRVWVG